MPKVLRLILAPLSMLYGLLAGVRNLLFNTSILKTTSFDIPVICVGNLQVGGTGKTPFTEFLLGQLKDQYNIAVVSRGYGRGTDGYLEVKHNSDAEQVGDEPLQIKQKFNEVFVAVCESRVEGIQRIREDHPLIDLVILDDGMQHRAVSPYLTLLLTPYDQPFFKDHTFPGGRLREFVWGYKRADAIIATKCSSFGSQEAWSKRLSGKPVFFTGLVYNEIQATDIYGFSGLAKNKRFKEHLKSNYNLIGFSGFNDHHRYTQRELDQLIKKSKGAQLVCTQKDKVKLQNLKGKEQVEALSIEVNPLTDGLMPFIIRKLEEFES